MSSAPYLFTTIDFDGDGDPTVALAIGEEDVANKYRALAKKERKSGESREVKVYSFDAFTGRTELLDIVQVGEPLIVKDGSQDTRFRLVEPGGAVLHEFNARTGDPQVDTPTLGEFADRSSNAATPGADAYVPTGDNRDDEAV